MEFPQTPDIFCSSMKNIFDMSLNKIFIILNIFFMSLNKIFVILNIFVLKSDDDDDYDES